MNRYFLYTLRLVIFPMLLSIGVYTNCNTQPVVLNSNLENGGAAQNYILTDKGMFRQVTIIATATHTSGMWQFPKNSGNMTEVWRPDGPDQMIAGFNTIIDPGLSSASARYQTNSGGFQGLLPEVISGKYYTINVSEQTPTNSQYMSIMVTDTTPVKIEQVSNPEIGTADVAQSITIETDTFPSSTEIFYVRYTTDNFTTSDTARFSFTGKNGEAFIPGQPAGTTVTYYVYSTTEGIEFDFLNSMWINIGTLELDNNEDLYYSYSSEAILPVILNSLSSKQVKRHIEIDWSSSVEVNNDFYTVERYDGNEWREIGTVNALFGRSDQNLRYQFIDENPQQGFNLYRLTQTDIDGSSQELGETQTYYAGIDVQIFPNPATDIIYIAGHNLPDNAILRLNDIVGRNLVSMRNNGSLNAMDISKYPRGVYQLTLSDSNQNILTVQRVIKQ